MWCKFGHVTPPESGHKETFVLHRVVFGLRGTDECTTQRAPKGFQPVLGRKSFALSVGIPPRPSGIAYRRAYGSSTSWLFKKSLCSPLRGWFGWFAHNSPESTIPYTMLALVWRMSTREVSGSARQEGHFFLNYLFVLAFLL